MKSSGKILVVDDEKRICHNVKKILSKNNFEVTEALSARDALDKMAKESFSLVISDLVMPEMNGLELLKHVKNDFPKTKTVMMTAYASTDTAVKAIQLGALDYLPKPFTPEELRNIVDNAVSDNLIEAKISDQEKESINIDLDIPFDQDEVAKATGEAYAKSIGPSDMPVIEVKMPEPLEHFCEMGDMVCDIFKKLGATCKAGTKKSICPQKSKKKGKAKAKAVRPDVQTLVGIDQPFSYEEVVAVTGPEYVHTLQNEGVAFVPYEELKSNMTQMMAKGKASIDVDMPFDRDEVAKQTGDDYVDHLTRSDMPVVEVTVSGHSEHHCELGDMVCDIFKKLGATCKAGTKKALCPQKSKKKGKAKGKAERVDVRTLIGVDMPFNYEEVAAMTGTDYVMNLGHEGVSVPSYESLKENITTMIKIEQADRQAAQVGKPQKAIAKNILVIDDEVAVNNNIRKILTKQNYSVEQAVTKAEALEKINSSDYKLVLLDLRIPGVKDLELLSAIRNKRPEAKVIIITGYASIETAVESARMGISDYVHKPFTPNEIRQATDNVLRFAA